MDFIEFIAEFILFPSRFISFTFIYFAIAIMNVQMCYCRSISFHFTHSMRCSAEIHTEQSSKKESEENSNELSF